MWKRGGDYGISLVFSLPFSSFSLFFCIPLVTRGVSCGVCRLLFLSPFLSSQIETSFIGEFDTRIYEWVFFPFYHLLRVFAGCLWSFSHFYFYFHSTILISTAYSLHSMGFFFVSFFPFLDRLLISIDITPPSIILSLTLPSEELNPMRRRAIS